MGVLELRQHYSAFRIAHRLLELLNPLTVADDRRGDDDDDAVDDPMKSSCTCLRWLKIDRFERRANRELARVAIERAA